MELSPRIASIANGDTIDAAWPELRDKRTGTEAMLRACFLAGR
jgi:hypothetical protein